MNYNPEIHHRKSIRLKGYDYSMCGAYFVTICVQHFECRFGKIENKKMILNDAGKMINESWLEIVSRFKNITPDEYVVMPNHFHSIIFINDANADDKKIVGATLVVAPVQSANTGNRAGTRPAPTNANVTDANITNANVTVAPITLGDIISAFKSITTNKYIEGVKIKIYPSFDRRLWQRNYFEHIIRNNESLNKIRTYIINNPENWDEDKFYSEINLLPPLSFNP